MDAQHRVELTIEDGYLSMKLIHPDSGCEPPTVCACGRDLSDTDDTGCYDCRDGLLSADSCWLSSWFDNLTPDELLHGRVSLTVPIQAEWKNDHPKITLVHEETA